MQENEYFQVTQRDAHDFPLQFRFPFPSDLVKTQHVTCSLEPLGYLFASRDGEGFQSVANPTMHSGALLIGKVISARLRSTSIAHEVGVVSGSPRPNGVRATLKVMDEGPLLSIASTAFRVLTVEVERCGGSI